MMFTPTDRPRLIGVPPGADFPAVLHANVTARMKGRSPEELARVKILVATRRMQRRLVQLFQEKGALLLPQIGVITDVTHLIPGVRLPAPTSSLRRTLELKQLVGRLVQLSDTIPSSSAIELSTSLASLLDEMQSEGVPFEALNEIDADTSSGHWEQSLKFLRTIQEYINVMSDGAADTEARHRAAVSALCARWEDEPPETPVIIAGSTGSRGTTRLLMTACARLDQGAVVLPGFDFNTTPAQFDALAETVTEDHPQYRFAALMRELQVSRSDVKRWGDEPDEKRNRLISLSLRPANVTDQWLEEGPGLGDLVQATADYSLIEASQPRDEAHAIAVAIRHTLEQGKSVALIAPDATLARRVTTALRRWNITPDDSGGMPLSLSPTGRFFRHIGKIINQTVTPANLIALLKHPMTKAGTDRGQSQLMTQAFEKHLRRGLVVEVTQETLAGFADTRNNPDPEWIAWLGDVLSRVNLDECTLAHAVDQHVSIAELICGDAETLWKGQDGEAVQAVITSFQNEADFSEKVEFHEYFQLFEKALANESLREEYGPHPDVMIWGTLEARVQGADTVILGGLNEGVWPEQPSPDPWLNRQMRRDIGLLLPERQIGLAAHDFQQAAGAPEVVFSRALRSEDSETVPSRWLNRLLNLLGGLPENGGKEALAAMLSRGDRFVAAAAQFDQPTKAVPPAARPAPSPPRAKRPSTYSVTEIQRLIRDPYAVYARRVLNLKPLEPLTRKPDARLKGTVLHTIFEHAFSVEADFSDAAQSRERLERIAWHVLTENVPWPSIRSLWWGQLDAAADELIADEIARRAETVQLVREVEGQYRVPGTRFRINGKADRIDMLPDGLIIYDYKTGAAPSKRQIRHYDRQLLIEAVMAEAGAFRGLPASVVSRVMHLDVGKTPKKTEIKLEDENSIVTISRELTELLHRFDARSTGYISRRAMEMLRFDGDYDHLARYGEWDASHATEPEPVND